MFRRVGVWTATEFVIFAVVVATAIVGVLLLTVGGAAGHVAAFLSIAGAVVMLALNFRLLRRVRRAHT